MSQTVITLRGPTASGKTDIAISLIKQLPIEIVSVDSVMVY
ncbi:MAG: isopentenyl transferase family protein, partial [Gammaproteobacteria bacterium]